VIRSFTALTEPIFVPPVFLPFRDPTAASQAVILNIPFSPSMNSANAGPEDWICAKRDASLTNRRNKRF
jgi:hypothetical protein